MDILPHEKQIHEYQRSIEQLKRQNRDNPIFGPEVERLEEKLVELKRQVYAELTPWQRVQICRHPNRPHTSDYLENICEAFTELAGDRTFGNDRAVVGGLGTVGGIKCVIMGQEKGHDTESRIERNFGMLHPEGFRKARRLMKMAEKFSLPIVSLLDTPGAFPGLGAEERGQGWAIAQNLREMVTIATPIVVIVVGEGCSGGALGMGIGDVIAMLEHAYYSVISPEGCASILWKDAGKSKEAAEKLKLNAEDLLDMGVVDSIIREPLGGAHHDPQALYANVKTFIVEQFGNLNTIPIERLLEQRYQKFRRMGEVREMS